MVLKKEIKRLDRVFQTYIRERDSKHGWFTCISCGRSMLSKGHMQAGHYHSRRYMSLRWHEKNVNGQCVHCNLWLHGNVQGYTKGLITRYGQDIIQELDVVKSLPVKRSVFEIKELTKMYKEKTSVLRLEKAGY